ncbi:Bro1p NDAI_0C05600 [Naumovozyma dairenensis CBS 421]|uniref:BRO domain-containing protein 1 n=1 Tax=Naumovozyma dairenensis (strain ATCC 10597 / BCRC 20456 / CBS 421 / NBRC 0211 / NRRL Y-12639) TaxID=1071378 RepID=G0W8V8_NAUDC|nr:hypothetical protein NDAI_0C05600 [Naumovozyma dairenensis CBS 421]CCD24219.1 hypothetical protein NDAI_0C05600 [Naumovozyma dairenensis CBS 421]
MKTFIIDLKVKDTEPIDWKKGLSNYLKRSYGSKNWKHFYDEKIAIKLDHLRHNSNGELAPESLLEQNLRYYAFLEHLDQRLANNSSQLRMDFVWYDAQYPLTPRDQKYKQHTLTFEKSSTLFNIAVILSQAANDVCDKDDKLAIGYLSRATACFNYISENFLNSPSTDLQAENAQFLANLCHVEAQELFLQKLLNGPAPEKQASLISKLASAASGLYDKTSNYLKVPEERIIPYGESKWTSILTCKMYVYKSVTAYHYALHLEQEGKYGQAIAYLKLASRSITSSFPFKVWLKDFIDFEGFKDTIETKTKEMEKDNDYIYHDTIPSSVSLESIKPIDAIKCPSWEQQLKSYMETTASDTDSLYKGIVPMEIYEKESIYSEEKAQMLRNEMEATETANLEYTSFVDFTNLPKLITDLEKRYSTSGASSTEDPQVELMRKQLTSYASVIHNSPFNDVDKVIRDISFMRQEILDILVTLPSQEKENSLKLKASLVEASKSDEKLFFLVKPYMEEIKLLNNANLLWSKFNTFDLSSQNQPSLLDIDDKKTETILRKLKVVKKSAEALRVLKEERQRTLSELKEAVNEDDITSLLIGNKDKSDAELKLVFNDEMEKFKPLSTRIEATIFKQASIINEIKLALDDVFSLTGIQDKSSEERNADKKRIEFVDRLEKATNNFTIFVSDIQKGIGFYSSLLKLSKDLASSAKLRMGDNSVSGGQQILPPPLPEHAPSQPPPPQYSRSPPHMGGYGTATIDSQMANLNMNQSPAVPPRNYIPGEFPQSQPQSQQQMSTFSQVPTVPQVQSFPQAQSQMSQGPIVPPKQPPMGINGLLATQRQADNEERELQMNPTSFYNKSSVFDENLYSKYSG